MKKTVCTLFALALLFFLNDAAQAAPLKMRLSHQWPETFFLAAEIRDFKKLVEEKTKGQLIVEIYPAAQAFKPKELIPATINGSIEAGATTNFEWAGIVPAVEIFEVPFLLVEPKVIEKSLKGFVGDRLSQLIQAKGVVPIMWLNQSRWQLYTSNDKLLKAPADFKGKKIRGTSKAMNLGTEALGGSTVSVSGPEVYSALQRGTLDIGLTSADAALARHYDEVQKYGVVSKSFSVMAVVFVNAKFYNSLSPDFKKAVMEAAEAVENRNTVESEKSGTDAVVALKKKGMIIHELTRQEEDAWKAVQIKPVTDYFLKRTGKDGAELVNFIQGLKR